MPPDSAVDALGESGHTLVLFLLSKAHFAHVILDRRCKLAGRHRARYSRALLAVADVASLGDFRLGFRDLNHHILPCPL